MADRGAAADIRRVLSALRSYNRAYRRFAEGIPSPTEARIAFDRAFHDVMTLLAKPSIRDIISDSFTKSAEEIERVSDLAMTLEDFFEQRGTDEELSLGNQFGFSRAAGRKVLSNSKAMQVDSGLAGYEQIIERFTEIHNAALAEMQEARSLKKKPKQKRKRDITRAIASSTFGVGLVAANTMLPALFAISYGLAAPPLHQAVRDLIGDKKD